MTEQKLFCLKWNNFGINIIDSLYHLRSTETFVDVTISCQGQTIRAHKVILSACSDYFKELFQNDPSSHHIVILRDSYFEDVQALVTYIYRGEVEVSQHRMKSFLKTADTLKIMGLFYYENHQDDEDCQNDNVCNLLNSERYTKASDSPVEKSSDNDKHELSELVSSSDTKMKWKNNNNFSNTTTATDPQNKHKPMMRNLLPVDENNPDEVDVKNNNNNNAITTTNKLKKSSSRQRWNCMQPRQCLYCSKIFSNAFNLKQHIQNVHVESQGVSCEVCEKIVKNKWYLRKHQVTAHGVPLKRDKKKMNKDSKRSNNNNNFANKFDE